LLRSAGPRFLIYSNVQSRNELLEDSRDETP
jgi:hypothetical protein